MILRVTEGSLSQIDASALLGLSDRQVRRLAGRVRKEGAGGLAHRSRGKPVPTKASGPSPHRIPDSERDRVRKLYAEKYGDFGPTLAVEEMRKRDAVAMSEETLRQILLEKGLWQPQRRTPQHRLWRERKAHRGEMVQIDGSHHDWLEGRGPELVLMGYIDDATGEVFAHFSDYEGTLPVLEGFYGYVRKRGLPHSVYVDCHQTYRVNNREATVEEQLAGEEPKSAFEQALERVGVQVIHAHSPQAKGRIERFFRTAQDRLVKQMRLAGVRTREEANRYLKKFLVEHNQKFGRVARESADWHRPIPQGMNLQRVLCVVHPRTVKGDNTVQFAGKHYLIMERWKGCRPKTLQVEERFNGRLYFMHQDQSLKYRELSLEQLQAQKTAKKASLKGKTKPVASRRATVTPAADHPWRKYPLLLSRKGRTSSQAQRGETRR